jgi:hypothetical protein
MTEVTHSVQLARRSDSVSGDTTRENVSIESTTLSRTPQRPRRDQKVSPSRGSSDGSKISSVTSMTCSSSSQPGFSNELCDDGLEGPGVGTQLFPEDDADLAFLKSHSDVVDSESEPDVTDPLKDVPSLGIATNGVWFVYEIVLFIVILLSCCYGLRISGLDWMLFFYEFNPEENQYQIRQSMITTLTGGIDEYEQLATADELMLLLAFNIYQQTLIVINHFS